MKSTHKRQRDLVLHKAKVYSNGILYSANKNAQPLRIKVDSGEGACNVYQSNQIVVHTFSINTYSRY